jgi:hypothetical protein
VEVTDPGARIKAGSAPHLEVPALALLVLTVVAIRNGKTDGTSYSLISR